VVLRLLSVFLMAAMILCVAAPVRADLTVECTVVQAGDGKLTVLDGGGNQHTAAVASDAKLTLDGKDCKLEDLKKGLKVKLTVRKDGGQPAITWVEGVSGSGK